MQSTDIISDANIIKKNNEEMCQGQKKIDKRPRNVSIRKLLRQMLKGESLRLSCYIQLSGRLKAL